MLKGVADLTSQDFSRGLSTVNDIFNVGKDQSPNLMNVRVNVDGSLQKRLGSTTMNSVSIGSTTAAGWSTDSTGTLTTSLIAWWKLNEVAGNRSDDYDNHTLLDNNTVASTTGLLQNAALFVSANSEYLLHANTATLATGDVDFSMSAWVFLNSTGEYTVIGKRDQAASAVGVDSNVTLLLHMDGAAGSTSFPDASDSAKTVTARGDAQVDTAQSVFGGASGKFDGAGDFLSVPDADDWFLGTSSWTIDTRIRLNSTTYPQGLVGQFTSDAASWLLLLVNGQPKIDLEVNAVQVAGWNWTPSANVWYHLEIVRNGNNFTAYIDGSGLGTQTSTTSFPNIGTDLRIGRTDNSGVQQYFNGWLDELRLTKGVAQHTSDFTPPAQAYARASSANDYEYWLYVNTDNVATFRVSSSGIAEDVTVRATSFGALSTSTWYNLVAWHDSIVNNVGIAVNLSANSSAYTSGVRSGSAPFVLGAVSNGASRFLDGRLDEVGFWKKVLSAGERQQLYAGGSGNTYSRGAQAAAWASFDFGASNIRWYVVAAGTGVAASSNLGVTFTTVATSQTANYQWFERSRNILVKTSDAYDPVLYWTGSGGSFMALLNPSAPLARWAINYQGFLILLNTNTRKRGFYWQDQNTQLTGAWSDSFDLPSSFDDEITAPFVLRRNLYVSTRYKIYQLTYVGGNPDWSFREVKDWGFVPRTVEKVTLSGVGETIVGASWDRRLRLFDGSDDRTASDHIEQDNAQCEFAMSKISYAGSGLVNNFAEFDTNEQAYKLCTTIGANSSDTTHFLCFNARNLALYPYDNMRFNTMVMVESANQRYLLAVDRSGFVHQLDRGVRDGGVTAVNEVYDSPWFYTSSPSQVAKAHRVDLFFYPNSAGPLYLSDRGNFAAAFKLRHVLGWTENTGMQVHKSVDVPTTQNVYQLRVTSSTGTADPWQINRLDFFETALGVGGQRTLEGVRQ